MLNPEERKIEEKRGIDGNGSIFLIGPMGTGKSSISNELSDLLPKLKHRKIDDFWFSFWENMTDYSKEKEEKIRREKGFLGVYQYWKKYEAELVKYLLSMDDNCSIADFGAGQTVYESRSMLHQIQKAFSTKNNIFLILPCESREECQRQLEERMEKREFKRIKKRQPEELSEEEIRTERVRVSKDEYILNQHFLDDISNRSLATHIVYTNGATPREVAEAIAEIYLGKDISSDKVKVILNEDRQVHIDDKGQKGDPYGE